MPLEDSSRNLTELQLENDINSNVNNSSSLYEIMNEFGYGNIHIFAAIITYLLCCYIYVFFILYFNIIYMSFQNYYKLLYGFMEFISSVQFISEIISSFFIGYLNQYFSQKKIICFNLIILITSYFISII